MNLRKTIQSIAMCALMLVLAATGAFVAVHDTATGPEMSWDMSHDGGPR